MSKESNHVVSTFFSSKSFQKVMFARFLTDLDGTVWPLDSARQRK